MTASLDQATAARGSATYAISLLAQRVPIWAIAKRLGHANPIVSMRMYQHAANLVPDSRTTGQPP